MLSVRAFARAAPRSICRLASTATRKPILASRISTPFKPLNALPATQRIAAFSTSLIRAAPAGETDEELSAKLESEIKFEEEVKENEPMPASIKDFLENGSFEVIDTPGKDEVQLTRTFGDEKITVSFSISDLASNYDPELYEDDAALGDEEFDGGSGAGGSGAEEGRSAAELAEEGVEEDGEKEAAVPCRLNIVVEKPGKGALNIEATAQDGSIIVDNLYYYDDAALAHSSSADAVHKAQDVYPGPPFGSLDEDLQILMERYLEERGITQAMAVFVPDYMDMKEQKEYLAWLNNIKTFIDA